MELLPIRQVLAAVNIAFISYEYPPESAYGGIGTYVYQAARMMRSLGHDVEVFSSSPCRTVVQIEDGILVHRVQNEDYETFSATIAPLFAKAHSQHPFDVLEGPEYGADALHAVSLVPDIALVTKLHTPTFLTVAGTYHGLPVTSSLRLKMLAGRLQKYVTRTLRGHQPVWKHTFAYHLDRERQVTLAADEIAAPSKSIAAILTQAWHLEPAKVFHVPYPYIPSRDLLDIPASTRTNVVTFLGRLEVRKGVLDLARAIPIVLQTHPGAKFRFIGSSEHSHLRDVDMRSYLQASLSAVGSSVEFIDHVDPEQLAVTLSETDICVFPSIWENFANVCLESMSAARGVIASESGGMAEMLNYGEHGITVPPRDHQRIAQAICTLLSNPEQRMALGSSARARILKEYSVDRIGALQEASYIRAIEARKRRGRRAV